MQKLGLFGIFDPSGTFPLAQTPPTVLWYGGEASMWTFEGTMDQNRCNFRAILLAADGSLGWADGGTYDKYSRKRCPLERVGVRSFTLIFTALRSPAGAYRAYSGFSRR
jgi:hypothetical protein